MANVYREASSDVHTTSGDGSPTGLTTGVTEQEKARSATRTPRASTRPAAMVACVLALLALAACSSGSSKSSETAGPSSTAAAGPTTTSQSVDTRFTGQDSAAFCKLAKTYNDQAKTVAPTATPAQLRATLRDGLATVNSAVSAAPAEIKADMQTLASTFSQLADAFEAANYDPAKVAPTSLQSLQSPQFQAATVRFQAYLHNVCGFTT